MVTILKGTTSAELLVPIDNSSVNKDYESMTLNYVGFGYSGSAKTIVLNCDTICDIN